jgi:hypothetical protein
MIVKPTIWMTLATVMTVKQCENWNTFLVGRYSKLVHTFVIHFCIRTRLQDYAVYSYQKRFAEGVMNDMLTSMLFKLLSPTRKGNVATFSTSALQKVQGKCVITCCLWTCRSPDLNPCNYYLWGTPKDCWYEMLTFSAITDNYNPHKTANISRQVLHHVSRNIFTSWEVCLAAGQHSETLLRHTVSWIVGGGKKKTWNFW